MAAPARAVASAAKPLTLAQRCRTETTAVVALTHSPLHAAAVLLAQAVTAARWAAWHQPPQLWPEGTQLPSEQRSKRAPPPRAPHSSDSSWPTAGTSTGQGGRPCVTSGPRGMQEPSASEQLPKPTTLKQSGGTGGQ